MVNLAQSASFDSDDKGAPSKPGIKHKSKAIRQALRGAGAHRLFLPPYSPDLNPIEQAFAKLKHWLRKTQPRSLNDVHQAIARTLDRFQPKEGAAFFRNSGYAST